ncbi:MAG: hypothetical protein ACI8TQ_001351 [Planctomycetota bacterium]
MNNSLIISTVAMALTFNATPTLPHAESTSVTLESVFIVDFNSDALQFEEALKVWEAKYEAIEDRKEKRAFLKSHPVGEFGARMLAHFSNGELTAAEWCLEHIRELDVSRKDRESYRIKFYDALIKDARGERRERTLERFFKDNSLKRAVGLVGLKQRVLQFNAKEPNSDQRGFAMYTLASKYVNSRDEAESTWAFATIDELLSREVGVSEDPEVLTLAASFREEAEKSLFASKYLAVGKIAPDFTGTTIDGEAVTLSATRGKVTVIDFFGFW